MNEEKTVMNEKEASSYIGMSLSYLQHARCDGKIKNRTPGPSFIRIGRTVRYLKSDLDHWVMRHRVIQE